ncbi:hypothetical protein BJ742DRAFT_683000 [Cladochytrium replicatum]|nr:hypothetical protein BJ742DRAFT_683000 [Cladochytrium replicatum]
MHLQHLPLASSASIPRVDGDLHSSSSTAFERSSPPDPALSWSPTSLSSESPSTPPSKLLFGDGNEFPQIPTSAQSSSASLPTSISASSIVDSVNNQGTDNISTTPPISPVAPAVPVPATNLAIVREIQTSKLRVDDKILTKEYFDQLTREVRELCAEVCPTPDEARRQEVVFESLEELAKKVFPEAQLHHFGSTANGFSLAGADMDLCLSIPDANKLNLAQCVEKLGHALKGAGMKDVKMLTRARVPIVAYDTLLTLWLILPFNLSGIRCDIGFQNSLAVFNTKLLKTYSDIDPRFRELVLVVKHWSKRRNINEPYFGTLSSYCYVLMVIHLLQVRGVLPCLQRIKPKSFTGLNGTPCDMDSEGIPVMEVDGHNVYFYDEVGRLDEHWKCQNDESLGELLVALFKYYSAEFPYVHGVASVRTGKVLSKEEKGWTKERQQELNRNGAVKDRYWLCVEDPFEVSNNIGRPVDKETLYEVRGEFIRASKLLCAGGGSSGVPENVLGRVCEKNLKKVSMNGTGNGVSVQTNMPGVGGNGVHPISPLGPTAPTSVMMSNGMSGGVVTGGMGLPVGNGYRKW